MRPDNRNRVLLTGASGFIGTALVRRLHGAGREVRPIVRAGGSRPHGAAVGPSLSAAADWAPLLTGIETVVHTAALTHAGPSSQPGLASNCMEVNAHGTRRLAEQAIHAGVKHFVFISSAHVHGTESSAPFCETDQPTPHGPYAESKLAAEQALMRVALDTPMRWTIIRPPLVYGPGARGNFARLVRLLSLPVPLPFASVSNARSMVSLGNLCDFVSLCVRNPAAADQLFLVSDGVDLSTPVLMNLLRKGMGKPPMLFPLPPGLLRAAARLLGQAPLYQQLCGSLQIDISKARERLGWVPTETPEQGLAAAVAGSRAVSAAA